MEEVIASELLELPDDEVERIVRRYFDDAEWQSLSELAKLRHIRMYVNYVGNPEFAALLPKPDFLKNVSKAAVPLSEKVKRKVTKVTKSAKSEGEVSFKSRKCDDTLKKSYPKRSSAPKVNYFEDEIADDDRYIFCDECQVEVVDFCDKCGMLVTIEDVKVPMGVPDRARKTVPEALEIKPSPVHGLGVFATKTVPKGVQLGPYEGKLTKVENTMGYSWKLRNGRLVDAGDESISNWTRYVNCADHMSRQNLVAFQYKGNLYYRTARTINAGEELLVFYGKSFAEKLGVDVKSYFNPQCEELKKDFYPCEFCGVGLCSQKYRAMHQKYCMKGRICLDSFACQFCKCCFMTETHRNHHQRKCVKVPTKDNTKRSRAIKGDACTKCKLTTKYTPDIKANKFQCHLCNFETRYKFNLTVHARRHDNTFGFVCPCCKKIFKQKLHLDSHYISRRTKDKVTIITGKIVKGE
ncbi:histone-lysine N-methyltransferase PRDM9-like [Cylas formicarius]|uniref:histone-lysine N-methyltransferase PRDM9-like n=1 Tax=Cylas formicarius TaxID=197179 RepID=UPI002958C45D|nr:histone-lysine N-methyltransferase PRDM9-like [Cylas formicarius]